MIKMCCAIMYMAYDLCLSPGIYLKKLIFIYLDNNMVAVLAVADFATFYVFN